MGQQRPPLTVEQIVGWADAHHARTGRWPTAASGPVADAPGEHWRAVNNALYGGYRGLPGGDSLANLLDRHGRGTGRPRRRSRPWTAEEEELVRTLPPAEAARRTGRSLEAVYVRRYRLGINPLGGPGQGLVPGLECDP